MSFPSKKAENSGNIVHGNAPFSLFEDAHFAPDRNWPGYHNQSNFKEFVNTNCSHVIITVANLVRANNSHPATIARYEDFSRTLDGYDVPIVLFGLGAQSNTSTIEDATLPPEGVELLKKINERCLSVSVRGQFTAALFKKYASTRNVHVTGCPSFFMKPEVFTELRQASQQTATRFAYNGTHYDRPAERQLLHNALSRYEFIVEPANPRLYKYHLESIASPEAAEIPDELAELVAGPRPAWTRSELATYFSSRFKLFRHLEPWLDFNREHVDFTYGTRFHVNMASMLSAVPALWLTHDSRTRELTETLHLPAVTLEEAHGMSQAELHRAADHEPLFDNLKSSFQRFNSFLDSAELPRVPYLF